MIGLLMDASTRHEFPVVPLLRAYAEKGIPSGEDLARLPGVGPRFQAVLAAKENLFHEARRDGLSDAALAATLLQFYQACAPPALHGATVTRRVGILRHALSHLQHGADPLPRKLERCLAVEGPYHVAGLGPAFWSALGQGLDPQRYPAWTPLVIAGLRRIGGLTWRSDDRPGTIYSALIDAYDRLRGLAPALTALQIDHFLMLVAGMQGRQLESGTASLEAARSDLAAVIRQERSRWPLRRRLKERGHALQEARRQLEAGLTNQDGKLIGAALSIADPAGSRKSPINWQAHAQVLAFWVGQFWQAQLTTDELYETLDVFWRTDPLDGAGLWLPAAILHLKDPRQFHPWNDGLRQGYAALDDGIDPAEPIVERYRLFNEGMAALRSQYHLHPLEAPDVLAALAPESGPDRVVVSKSRGKGKLPARFGGFCADTFHFLGELEQNNRRAWMNQERDRYRFAVREPLVELCRALAERYVKPVLCQQQGWDLETAPRSGRALTSICKNDYGRSVPYHTCLWITFSRRGLGGKREDVQFFVRLDRTGLTYGLRIGRQAREAGRLFRRHVQEHAELLYRALCDRGAFAECRLSDEENPEAAFTPSSPGDLRAWAAGKALVAAKKVPAGAPLLAVDDLVGDILLTFDRLLPAYACAVESEPLPTLERQAGLAPEHTVTAGDFCRNTFLSEDWLRRARALLDLKRQLILQGVPGTGKTHVARWLARLLTGGQEEAVRLVQFHPAYSYEEFVEGIKVRSVEVNGRHDVTYPVEDGLLCAFATEAARHPAEPHVLIIDEINRGNLPRIFGELLYLLEYREQTVRLPYSKRGFALPANLYLIGTMNAADRSVALIDQALRRRFSFVEMPPDVAVLSAWLREHPPAAGVDFTERILTLFTNLNTRLLGDLGPHCQVGHSYFMVPQLDEARLRVVWEHHVTPLLEEYFAGQPGKVAGYELEELLVYGGRLSGGGKRTGKAKAR